MIKLPRSIIHYYQKLHRQKYQGFVIKDKLFMMYQSEINTILKNKKHRETINKLAQNKNLINPIFISCLIINEHETLIVD